MRSRLEPPTRLVHTTHEISQIFAPNGRRTDHECPENPIFLCTATLQKREKSISQREERRHNTVSQTSRALSHLARYLLDASPTSIQLTMPSARMADIPTYAYAVLLECLACLPQPDRCRLEEQTYSSPVHLPTHKHQQTNHRVVTIAKGGSEVGAPTPAHSA